MTKEAIAFCVGIDIENQKVFGCDFFSSKDFRNPLRTALIVSEDYKKDNPKIKFIIGGDDNAQHISIDKFLGDKR